MSPLSAQTPGLDQIPTGPKNQYQSVFIPAKARDTVKDYSHEALKQIADTLIADPYYRRLVNKSDYIVVRKEDGVDFRLTYMPAKPEEVEIYRQQIPYIVHNFRVQVENKLNKEIRIADLMNELSENHSDIFPFTFDR